RSGKSRFAVSDPSLRGRVAFVATARAEDGDMARRIARHRAERPRHFTTVEEPHDLVACLARLEGAYDAVVVDCLTLWVSNRLLRGDGEDALLDEAEALAKLIGRRACVLTLVSNEVGAGVPGVHRPVIFTFAADHGVVAEGVSAYPQIVTAQMVENFLGGGAAVNVLARQAGARVVVADFGVANPTPTAPGLVSCPIAPGTANLARGPAMTR